MAKEAQSSPVHCAEMRNVQYEDNFTAQTHRLWTVVLGCPITAVRDLLTRLTNASPCCPAQVKEAIANKMLSDIGCTASLDPVHQYLPKAVPKPRCTWARRLSRLRNLSVSVSA